ncbi:rhombosortase [Acinetobacter ihumii]|uniref:rhombosortase n=1 Tax=Acinetobacter ihumii TaxID=2483802 RepID=UPI001031EA87|nr:rhombosortase [Acinetobacter ihumii]
MNDKNLIKKVIFIAVCISISASLQVFSDAFIYWRESLPEQFWRLWTAHWVHVGWMHFFLNMLAFACLPFIFPHAKTRLLTILLLLLSPFISLMFFFFMPQIEAYAGLSGVLHGMYVAVALVDLKYPKERNFALLVLALVSMKLIWENTWGNSSTAQLIGSPVLVEAHWLGALGGVLLGGTYILKAKLKSGKVTK